MKKVITYGTFDLFHYGHQRLLERAKALGDYLIVGVTSDAFDLARGKINAQQSLMERIEAVRKTGIADEIIVEEYEGQKIDDIKRYGIDIFTVGSDWKGKFDYLEEFCNVVYLERTEGVSSSDIRSEKRSIKLGLVGNASFLNKVLNESKFVNGLEVVGICSNETSQLSESILSLPCVTDNLNDLLIISDAIYIISSPVFHYNDIKAALNKGVHVLCESPICLSEIQWKELIQLADSKGCVLFDAIRTAYSVAFSRLILLVKSGRIGDVVSIDATCTSLRNQDNIKDMDFSNTWNSLCTWGPAALLPIFILLGTTYNHRIITSRLESKDYDSFTKIAFTFPHAVASIKVGNGVKSESELIISGTKGYVYVPAPWWKMDYFEIRFEDPTENRRYFYQLNGEGIRLELLSFLKTIESKKSYSKISPQVSVAIVRIIEDFYNGNLVKI